MEVGGNIFSNSIGNNWDIWELNVNASASGNLYTPQPQTAGSTNPQVYQHSLYCGDGSRLHQDPHLMCLKLGKRQYFEDANTPVVERLKRGKSYYGLSAGGSGGVVCSATAVPVPRCQVEGCDVALVNAKDYHRRHKVCEMHSKEAKVVVLGIEQRFCQQCSRFHVVSEFDDSKRSCRRRLAGHNERRRKSSHDSVAKNSSQGNKLMTGRLSYLSSPTGRALSLLSSKSESWVSPSDLSFRSSEALRELIAENRAATLAHQLIQNREWHLHHQGVLDVRESDAGPKYLTIQQRQLLLESSQSWSKLHESSAHVTLNLMHGTSSAFGLLSVRGKTKEEEEDSELWNYGTSLEGASVG